MFACAIKAALLLAASAVGAVMLRRSSAAARHQMWTLGVLGALVLPVLCWLVPSSITLEATAARDSLLGAPVIVKPRGAELPWVTILWAAGSLVVAVRFVAGHLAARRLVRSAEPINVLGVDVLRSERISSPMTIGIVRPRVVLPAVADAWSPERLRAVLAHELGHVRRRDVAFQIAAQLACALYWWNPLAWLAASQMRVEREHACDDLVLEAGVLPSSYAMDLVEVTRSTSQYAVCMVDATSSIEARVRRILDEHAPRGPHRARFALYALAAGCAGLLACMSTPAAAPAPKVTTLSVGAPFRTDGYVPGAPTKHGTIDLSLVATEVQRRLPNLEQCYQRRLAANPALAGTVVIHWVISQTGAVVDQCITTDTVGDIELVECVNKLVAEGDFPAPLGAAVDVSFPFVFDGV